VRETGSEWLLLKFNYNCFSLVYSIFRYIIILNFYFNKVVFKDDVLGALSLKFCSHVNYASLFYFFFIYILITS
jgi:hypothetical protein